MNELVKLKGGRMLEAPVTGGLEALKKGQMTVFMAGENTLAEEVRPMLESIYCNVIYTGKMGTALIPKVLSNMLTCVHNLAMGEVFMIAKKSGVDMKTCFDCIRARYQWRFLDMPCKHTTGPCTSTGTRRPATSRPRCWRRPWIRTYEAKGLRTGATLSRTWTAALSSGITG